MNIVFLYDIKMNRTIADIIGANNKLIDATLSELQNNWQQEKNELEEIARLAMVEINKIVDDRDSLKADLKLANDEIDSLKKDNECFKGETILMKDKERALLEMVFDAAQKICNLESELKLAKDKIKELESNADIVLIENNESSFNERLAAIQNQLDELKKEYADIQVNKPLFYTPTYSLYNFLLANLNTSAVKYMNDDIWITSPGRMRQIYCNDDKYYSCDGYTYDTREELLKAVKMLLE